MELITKYLIDSYVYLQLIPVIFGLAVYKRINSEYKLFVILLVYIFFNEIFKLYYGTYITPGENRIFTNIFNIVNFCFLFWLFYIKSNTFLLRKTILVISFLYVVALLYELIVVKVDYHTKTQVIPYIIGGFGILICVFFYFYSLLNSVKIINIYSDLLFWIAIAHFIYYLGFTPLKVIENYFTSLKEYHHLFQIKVVVTVLKGIILSIGFICSQKKI